MLRAIFTILFVVLAGALGSCAAAPPPQSVALIGASGDLAHLAGDWHGEYWSAATGRRGTIRFALESDTGAAWGDVWMFPGRVPGAGDEPRSGAGAPLQIRFVRIGPNGTLNGTIEPYTDPDCACLLSTTFVGKWRGNRMEGSYTTQGGPGHPAATGQWEARRERTRDLH